MLSTVLSTARIKQAVPDNQHLQEPVHLPSYGSATQSTPSHVALTLNVSVEPAAVFVTSAKKEKGPVESVHSGTLCGLVRVREGLMMRLIAASLKSKPWQVASSPAVAVTLAV